MTSYEDVCAMVSDLMDADSALSSWEWDYVNDMSDKIAAGETFSAKQTETIVRIWEEKV